MTALAMALRLAHTAADRARTDHDVEHRVAAVIGSAAAIRMRRDQGYCDFDIYRVSQGGALVLLRFDLDGEDLGHLIRTAFRLKRAGWKRITAAELE